MSKTKAPRNTARKLGKQKRGDGAGKQVKKSRISKRRQGRNTKRSRPRSRVLPNTAEVSGKLPVKHAGGRPRGSGGIHLENTLKEEEVLEMLLEPNVETYADAGKRLGISENAVKQRMGRVLFRWGKAKAYVNRIDKWKIKRKEKKGRVPKPLTEQTYTAVLNLVGA